MIWIDSRCDLGILRKIYIISYHIIYEEEANKKTQIIGKYFTTCTNIDLEDSALLLQGCHAKVPPPKGLLQDEMYLEWGNPDICGIGSIFLK